MAAGTFARRMMVISDLHLGGSASPMMSRPDRLVRFLRALPNEVRSDEKPELVIAGDFVDFLSLSPQTSWTAEPDLARRKLCDTMDRKPFGEVFNELSNLVRSGWALTILLGNHDLELALPAAQEALWQRLSAGPHQVFFLVDGRAYRVGGLLIEHGNRYDGANANDWECLRVISSAYSRAESAPVALRASFGSQFVVDHINPLKRCYPFLDLIQPQTELVALLLLAFEPDLIWDWRRICAGLKAQRLHADNLGGVQPTRTYQIGASTLDRSDEELRTLFGPVYEQLLMPAQEAGMGLLLRAYLDNRKDSLGEILRRGDSIAADRLQKIRVLLRRLLLNDASDRLDGPTEQYGKAAERLLRDGDRVQAVIMGHTHLPRKIFMDRGMYINTGTWIDRISVPDYVLEDGADEALEAFLCNLLQDRRPDRPATYADVRVNSDGRIGEIDLKKAQ